jgi:hypothetical protein
MANYQPGVFTYNATTADFSFNGVLYRHVPSYTDEPLTPRFSSVGGRWNQPNSHLLIHTYTSFQTAQVAITNQAYVEGFDWEAVNPSFQQDLLVLQLNVNHLADLATNGGLQSFGLPIEYPLGFQNDHGWSTTRPIGHGIFSGTASGLVTRSASLSQWNGAMEDWAEVVLFPDRSDTPVLLERIPFRDWYYR